MITAKNITLHEFIGLDTMIIQSTNPQVVGLNGRIINETKSMFTIDTSNGPRSIAKETSSWEFLIAENYIVVKGSRIAKRPFDRISRGGKA